MTQPSPSSVPTTRPGDTEWLLVDADDLLWLLPRPEALHLGPFVPDPETPPACGRLNYQGQSYPVVYWSRRLKLGTPQADGCSSALLVQGSAGIFALACRRVMRIERQPRFYTLPQCMRGRHHAFTEVAVIKGRTAAKITADELLDQLPAPLKQRGFKQRTVTGG